MNFIVIRFIYSALSLLVSGLFFRSYLKGNKKNKDLRDFSIMFFLLAFYLIFLVSYIFTDDLRIVAWCYDIAVGIYFVMVVLALRMAFSFLNFNKKISKLLIGFVLLIGLGIISYQLAIPSIPEITTTPGLVWWNVDKIVLILTGLAGFFAGNIWMYAFYLNFNTSETKINKVKSILIAVASSALGFSSLTYFYPSELSFFLSFIFGLIGVIGFLIVGILRLKK